MNNAKMLQRAPTQSRTDGTVGLRANYSKIRCLPYISNPTLVGLNCSLRSSLPLGPVRTIFTYKPAVTSLTT